MLHFIKNYDPSVVERHLLRESYVNNFASERENTENREEKFLSFFLKNRRRVGVFDSDSKRIVAFAVVSFDSDRMSIFRNYLPTIAFERKGVAYLETIVVFDYAPEGTLRQTADYVFATLKKSNVGFLCASLFPDDRLLPDLKPLGFETIGVSLPRPDYFAPGYSRLLLAKRLTPES